MRTRSEPNSGLNDLIALALDRGIIDASQRDRLRDLAAEMGSMAPARAEESNEAPKVVEARRGFNAITIAYSLGALLVLFALGWFLVDR